MREFQERRRFKKFLHSRYAIAVLIILCGLLAQGVWSVYGKYQRSRVIAERTRAELATLTAREDALGRSIADLGTDLGREREIRDRFGAVKEGERLIVLVDDKSVQKPVLNATEESLWDRFVGFFMRD